MAMEKENFLYFAESDVATTGEALCPPSSAFLGLDPISATQTRLSFKAQSGAAVDDDVLITHANISADPDIHKRVAEWVARMLSNPAGKFIVAADDELNVYNEGAGGSVASGSLLMSTVAVTKA